MNNQESGVKKSETVILKKNEWKTIGVRIKFNDLPLFNRRLSLYGFETLGALVADFLTGKFPVITEDRQIQSLDSNMQSNGMQTTVNGQFEPTFYKNIDLDDMLNYLLNIRKFQNHNARSLVNYFRRFRDIFFGSDPAEILKLKPHKRSWILQAIRHFGNYYNYKTNNPECKELIEKIINRYGLNIGLDMHQKIYIVDDNYVVNKVKDLMAIPGEIGLTVKVGLYSGLRQEEIIYLHNTDICNNLSGCSCNKLHLIKKSNRLTVVIMNLFRGHKKCYFTILPTLIFEQFRKTPNFDKGALDVAHKLTKRIVDVKFVELRKIHYNVMSRVMDMNEADILAGRAKSVSARHYALYELDSLTDAYIQGWQRLGITF
jgi:intergrase/recombinase